MEKRIPDDVAEQLRARGHKVEVRGDWSNSCAPTIVEYKSTTTAITAGADVRGHRYALAW